MKLSTEATQKAFFVPKMEQLPSEAILCGGDLQRDVGTLKLLLSGASSFCKH
jgi:hypothetical protein